MPQARYLAPWHQPDVWELVKGKELDEEALRSLQGKPAIYHCISRVAGQAFLLEEAEKEQFVRYMRLYEAFCLVRVLAFCVMTNHFHILLEVPSPPEGRGRDWTDDELLEHLGCLYPERKLADIRWKLAHFREQGNTPAAEKLRESFFRRMWDLSSFMQVLKQRFTRWFNRQHARTGTLWEDRFKSVLVEDGHAARVMAAYIDLNPVRAGMVDAPEAYRWSSYGEAVAGNPRAREGLQRVLFERESAVATDGEAAALISDWRKALQKYRRFLGTTLRPREDDATAEAAALTEGEAIRQRVRYFADGMVIGTEAYVDASFVLTRNRFGAGRTSGARKLRRVSSALRSMRDLQVCPLG